MIRILVALQRGLTADSRGSRQALAAAAAPPDPQVGAEGVLFPTAAAAALHIPLIDRGGDVPVAEAPPFQRVLITAVEGDVARQRHLLTARPLHLASKSDGCDPGQGSRPLMDAEALLPTGPLSLGNRAGFI